MRGFADGYVSLLLPAYLILLGMNPFQVGVIATATLFGSGTLTLLVGFHAWRLQYRTLLLAATAVMAITGFGFAGLTAFWPLLVIAVVGTLNPSSGDVSVFLPLEHAVLSRAVNDTDRTETFSRYALVGQLAAAVGALCAGLPNLMVAWLHADAKLALQAMFALYGIIGLVSGAIYFKLPSESRLTDDAQTGPLDKSKRHVYSLAALFCIDALGGGFTVQSMLALWLFERFSMSTSLAGTIFFWSGLFSAVSYPLAVRIAKRIGLVRTMVFTHLPASICLIIIPFVPSLVGVVALLLVRSALSQMDVPTRSSYVMAIVPPEERAAAASITNVPRSLASAAGPVLAGYLLNLTTFGWPLVIAGGLKTTYDLLLLNQFHHVRPPEEMK